MAVINYYVSIPFRQVVGDDLNNAGIDSGTSSSSTDYIELRMMVQNGSSVATGLTRRDVVKALKVFERWVLEGGLVNNPTGGGTNVPWAAS
jgi:hypothetical protein